MTKIEIEIANDLNGSKPYMAAILVDSYGDKLLIDLLKTGGVHVDKFFTPCPNCGVPVLDSSIGAGSEVCDHCTVKPDTLETVRQPANSSLETRIVEATELADIAFWKTIAECFPEAKTGDFQMIYNPEPMVRHWVELNVPAESEPWTDSLDLHYAELWRMLNTGGNVSVVITRPIGQKYLGVTAECVILYQLKTEGEWLEEDTDEAVWGFGDSPIELVKMLEQYLDNSSYDVNCVFDDIMTVGKSNLV